MTPTECDVQDRIKRVDKHMKVVLQADDVVLIIVFKMNPWINEHLCIVQTCARNCVKGNAEECCIARSRCRDLRRECGRRRSILVNQIVSNGKGIGKIFVADVDKTIVADKLLSFVNSVSCFRSAIECQPLGYWLI